MLTAVSGLPLAGATSTAAGSSRGVGSRRGTGNGRRLPAGGVSLLRRLSDRRQLLRVCASSNPYEDIKANRAARKAAKEKAGDVVEVAWECADPATGTLLDSSTKAGIPRNVSFQMGTDAGFQPKNGLKLAFNYACEGLMVGETARVVSRPSGKGWFRAYEVLSEDGMLLAQLNPEERRQGWAEQEAVFTVEVVSIAPPRGRAKGARR